MNKACNAIGISKRSIYRWKKAKDFLQDLRKGPKNNANALSITEENQVYEILTSERFVDQTPYSIVATLSDEETYLCSESTMYRILKKYELTAHRRKSKIPAFIQLEPLIATRPNEIWSWDISYLKSPIKGKYFYLYLFMDIFSRKIIGWEIHLSECSIKASDFAQKLILSEHISSNSLRVHSDNGTPMKSASMVSLLESLSVFQSFSRPSVSNDNPYSEALFKTLKYKAEYPKNGFIDIEEAKRWVTIFVEWYNYRHKHSGIKFITPDEKHRGMDVEILAKRKILYQAAAAKNPIRFINGIKNLDPVQEAKIKGYREKTKKV